VIQILAKLRFIERYCNLLEGWKVFVDIDPEEDFDGCEFDRLTERTILT